MKDEELLYYDYQPSKKRKRMSSLERASQFAPFAALTGHKEKINETQRYVDDKKNLDASQIQMINEQLFYLSRNKHMKVKMTYFQRDDKKIGGKQCQYIGFIKKIDEYQGCVVVNQNMKISFHDLYDIELMEE